jgi:hypothetical protein
MALPTRSPSWWASTPKPSARRPGAGPAVPRRLPDDEDAADEFRRFTERSCARAKSANARTVLDALAPRPPVVLGSEQSGGLAGHAQRPALAHRPAGSVITEENHDSFLALPEDHPAGSGVYLLYDWLTFLQETLQAMLGTSLWPEDRA